MPVRVSEPLVVLPLFCRYCIGVRTEMKVELRNTGAQPLCYKIQTSNPKRYSVTPRCGRVTQPVYCGAGPAHLPAPTAAA